MRFALLLLLVASAASAAPVDGPYVFRGADGRLESWTVEFTASAAQKRVTALAPGATLTIAPVGELPAFSVKLRGPEPVAPDAVKVDARAPLYVVADTHGEFEILAQQLVAHKVLDAKLRWRFGRGHLVFLGDVLDRGPNQLEILWLIYSLEAQATKAGGGVDFVIGNHETMDLRGDLRYLNPKYVASATTLGVASFAELFGSNSVLGQWLRAKPAVKRVGDYLCLHGGISPELVQRKLTLAQINDGIRAALGDSPPRDQAGAELADFLMKLEGPMWYRGYFSDQRGFTPSTDEDVSRSLSAFGVKRILIGHTIVPTITPLYGGKVIAIQVYPKHEDTGATQFENLLIRDGKLFRALPDGSEPALALPAP